MMKPATKILKLKAEIEQLESTVRQLNLKVWIGDYPHRDNCERCHGGRGGVKGNENVIDGRILCDYCTVDVQNKETLENQK